MQLSIERVVTLASPLFAALSGAIVAWFAKNFPGGPQLDPVEIAGLFAIGASAGSAALLKWLHGRQRFVSFEADAEQVAAKLAAAVKASTPASIALSDFERILQAHADQIVAKVGGLVQAPPSVEQVATEIIQRAGQEPTLVPPAPPVA